MDEWMKDHLPIPFEDLRELRELGYASKDPAIRGAAGRVDTWVASSRGGAAARHHFAAYPDTYSTAEGKTCVPPGARPGRRSKSSRLKLC
jgi:hypothetical protein